MSNKISMLWRLSVSTAKLFIRSIVSSMVSFFGSILQTISYIACTIRLLVSLICAMYSFVRSLSVSTLVFASSLEILMLLKELLISSVRLVAILVRILSVALNFCIRNLSSQNNKPTMAKTDKPRNHHVFQKGGRILIMSLVISFEGAPSESTLFARNVYLPGGKYEYTAWLVLSDLIHVLSS